VPMLLLYTYTKLVPSAKQPFKKPVVLSYDPHFAPLPEGYGTRHRDSIEAFLKQLELSPFHGMVLIAKNGEVIFERYYGKANEQTGAKFSPETPVHVASISKVITAATVLRLVDQHKVLLDGDIRRYLPEIPYSGVTVRMLLNHRSGIPYYGYFSASIDSLPDQPMTNQRVLDILHRYRLPLVFPSGTHFAYCNTNYALLALIVEKVTGKRFPEAVQELVFDPLHMTHSFICGPGKPRENRALSYNSKGILQEMTDLDPVYGDKNLYTTARDLLRFDKGTYSDAFLSRIMKAEMYKGYSYERPGMANYGLGMRMREAPGKSTLFFHTGWWHGNTGCYASLRSDTVCMVILSNHYTRKVYGINWLSIEFGNYPFERFAVKEEEE